MVFVAKMSMQKQSDIKRYRSGIARLKSKMHDYNISIEVEVSMMQIFVIDRHAQKFGCDRSRISGRSLTKIPTQTAPNPPLTRTMPRRSQLGSP